MNAQLVGKYAYIYTCDSVITYQKNSNLLTLGTCVCRGTISCYRSWQTGLKITDNVL